jgi:predicted lactoylglutathione lyase
MDPTTYNGAAMTQIYVNLPVQNLERSVEFYTGLGYAFDPRFTDDNGTCMIVGENIFVMLLTVPFFQTFTSKTVCDASRSTEVIICISAESRAAVDSLLDKAIAAGARQPREPKDHGFMYERCYEDPDGHIWEVVHMQGEEEPDA